MRSRRTWFPSTACGAVIAALVLSAMWSGGSASAAAMHARSTGGPSELPAGPSTQTITVGGVARTYVLYRPSSVSGRSPVPLVVMLHGGFGSGPQAEKDYGWDAEADSHRFVVAYPNGLNRAWDVGGGCCGKPGASHVDDVAFISSMVAAVSRRLDIDPNRVYATGISNGGMMDYRLACDTSIFAAIGPDSATLLGTCPHPSPVSVIHIHGTADTKVPFNGGPGDGRAAIDGPSVPSVVTAWRRTDRCPAPSTKVAGPLTTTTARCPDGRSVELIAIAGAGHQWPGSASHPVRERLLGADPPSTALDATATIWTFFAGHPRPTAP
jgi:polyhydroxybutyrate depolymerase